MAKKKPEPITKNEIKAAVREVVRGETLKEELWRDAVKEGVEGALWNISGYALVAVFLLMLTGIIVASFVFAFLGYVVLGAAFPVP